MQSPSKTEPAPVSGIGKLEARKLLNELDRMFTERLGMNLTDAKIRKDDALNALRLAGERGVPEAFRQLARQRGHSVE